MYNIEHILKLFTIHLNLLLNLSVMIESSFLSINKDEQGDQQGDQQQNPNKPKYQLCKSILYGSLHLLNIIELNGYQTLLLQNHSHPNLCY